MMQGTEWLTSPVGASAVGAIGALAGTVGGWLSLRARVQRLERLVRASLRLQLQQLDGAAATPESKALVEALLADGPAGSG